MKLVMRAKSFNALTKYTIIVVWEDDEHYENRAEKFASTKARAEQIAREQCREIWHYRGAHHWRGTYGEAVTVRAYIYGGGDTTGAPLVKYRRRAGFKRLQKNW